MDDLRVRLKRFSKNPIRKTLNILARNPVVSRVCSWFIDSFGTPITGAYFVANVASWKQEIIRELLIGMGADDVIFISQYVPFHITVKQFRKYRGGVLVIWGIEAPGRAQSLAEKRDFDVWRMEDGFVRSVGLGSKHTPPSSIIIDKGDSLYFRCDKPSSIETFLQTHSFTDEERLRARRTINRILDDNITKYNLKETGTDLAIDRNVENILILGQCEDDNSIVYGSPEIKLNTALMLRVLGLYPDANIYFRPHPDVTAGTRVTLSDIYTLKDQVHILDGPFALWDNIQRFDRVCVMTSLGGFEALLRGVNVETFGVPFYAGWGLTQDHIASPRRTKHLTLEEVFYGAYIYAPTYLVSGTGKMTSLETVLESLSAIKSKA